MSDSLRFTVRQTKFLQPRWQVWDEAVQRPYAPYLYRSKHKANKSADRLNGLSNREGRAYRFAKSGTWHG